ncbi:MAG TPA: hypothetical protein VN903_24220 [Polyangia bacterium]|nr:hypothetical protein [Polyangia bacterium]
MESLENPLVQILLWLVAAAAAFWILAPGVMYLLRKSRYWIDVSENPADAEPDGRDRKYAARFREFVALGFRAAGKIDEHGRFMNPMLWSWHSGGTRFVASPDGKTFVGFHRVGGGNPLRTTAHSTFEEGGLIMTASRGTPTPTNAEAGGNYKYEAVGDAQADELLAMHARRTEEFARARRLTVKAATMRDIAAEDEKHTRLMMPKMKLGQLGSVVISLFLMPAAMTAAMMASERLEPAAPLIFCGCAALYALVRWSILPSRIPMMVRMAVMGAGLFIPSMWAINLTMPEQSVGRALDRMDAKVGSVDPARAAERSARMVDWIVKQGRTSCKALLPRLENAATKPQTRAVAHDALVRLQGSDLGATRAAWEAWCAEVTRPKQ